MLKIKNLVMLFSSTLKVWWCFYVQSCIVFYLWIPFIIRRMVIAFRNWLSCFRRYAITTTKCWCNDGSMSSGKSLTKIITTRCRYWAKMTSNVSWFNSFIQSFKVSTAAEYQRIVDSFPYRDANLEAAPFPKRFPFSSMVPRVYRQIRNYIQACLQFSQDLNLADQEIDDTLRRYTNLLLTRTLSGCLSTLIRKPSLSLLQLIQISINTNYLEESNSGLEEFIAQLTGASRELSHVARLQGRTVFRDVRDDAEQQIYEALKRKMDEFMELANYDWLLNEPSGHASSYLLDLIAFLQSTFQAFTNLKVNADECKLLHQMTVVGLTV